MSGADSTATKPQVKHILSKELQLYFEKVCQSVLDETQEEYRTAGLASLKDDPGLHQLVPYFVQFIAEKVTHNLKDLFVLTQMMNVTEALTRNDKLNLAPYVRLYITCSYVYASCLLIVLTCISVTGSFPYSTRSNMPHRPSSGLRYRPLPRPF
jgi:hypothetical protein